MDFGTAQGRFMPELWPNGQGVLRVWFGAGGVSDSVWKKGIFDCSVIKMWCQSGKVPPGDPARKGGAFVFCFRSFFSRLFLRAYLLSRLVPRQRPRRCRHTMTQEHFRFLLPLNWPVGRSVLRSAPGML